MTELPRSLREKMWLPRTADPRGPKVRPSRRADRDGSEERIGAIRPGDDVEVAREIARLWLEVQKARRWTNDRPTPGGDPGLNRWVEGGAEDVYLSFASIFAYWRLGEASGSTFQDRTTNDRDASKTGTGTDISYDVAGPTALGDGDDGAVRFNLEAQDGDTGGGAGRMIRYAAGGTVFDDFQGEFATTLACWAKPKASATGFSNTGVMGIKNVVTGGGGVYWDIGYGISWDSTANKWKGFRGGGDGVALTVISSAAGLADDVWYHLAITATPAGAGNVTIKFYVNGVLQGTATAPATVGSINEIQLGGSIWKNTDFNARIRYFYGDVDEPVMFEDDLTAAEIYQLYQANGAAGAPGRWVGTQLHGADISDGTLSEADLSFDPATQAELDAHINDASDAHDASAISYAGGTGMSATDVEAAVDELATEKISNPGGEAVDEVLRTDGAGGFSWVKVGAAMVAADIATQAELDAHEADTTSIHGITDTALLLKAAGTMGFTVTRGDIDDGPPGSPTTGDIWIAEDVGGENSGIAWTFIYNGDSTSAYKWEFVGGSPLEDDEDSASHQTSTSFAAASSGAAHPSVVLPRAGDYDLEWGGYAYGSDATLRLFYLSPDGAGTTANNARSAIWYTSNGVGQAMGGRRRRYADLTAATLSLQSHYTIGAGLSTAVEAQYLAATPIRVS